MNVPARTHDERAASLARATAVRQYRAALKVSLKSGDLTLRQVIAQAQTDPDIAKMRVFDVLRSMPKIGQAKARLIMSDLAIAERRRLNGLGTRQRSALLAKFDTRTPALL